MAVKALVKRHSNHDWQVAVIRGMYLTGKPLAAIAEKTGLTRVTVSKHISSLRKEWLAESREDHADHIAKELAKLDHLEATYWDAWEKSKAAKVRISTKEQGDPMVLVEKLRSRENCVGQSQFLEGVRWCIDRRSKLLGLDAPERKELFGAMTLQVYEQIVDARDGPMLSAGTFRELEEATLEDDIAEGEIAESEMVS